MYYLIPIPQQEFHDLFMTNQRIYVPMAGVPNVYTDDEDSFSVRDLGNGSILWAKEGEANYIGDYLRKPGIFGAKYDLVEITEEESKSYQNGKKPAIARQLWFGDLILG